MDAPPNREREIIALASRDASLDYAGVIGVIGSFSA